MHDAQPKDSRSPLQEFNSAAVASCSGHPRQKRFGPGRLRPLTGRGCCQRQAIIDPGRLAPTRRPPPSRAEDNAPRPLRTVLVVAGILISGLVLTAVVAGLGPSRDIVCGTGHEIG